MRKSYLQKTTYRDGEARQGGCYVLSIPVSADLYLSNCMGMQAALKSVTAVKSLEFACSSEIRFVFATS